jgi:hypothetical protein
VNKPKRDELNPNIWKSQNMNKLTRPHVPLFHLKSSRLQAGNFCFSAKPTNVLKAFPSILAHPLHAADESV